MLTIFTKPTTSTMPSKPTMLTKSTIVTTATTQARCHGGGGLFGALPPKPLLLPPKQILYPPSEDCAPKESNRLSATGWHFEAVLPQIVACAPKSE